MYNHVCEVGRLTKDPVLKSTQEGTSVSSFTIAVNRDYSNNDGEKKADFLPVVAWKKTAENCCKYLKKGSLVLVDGRLQSRSYQGNDGKKVYVIEIVADSVKFMDPPQSNQNNNDKANHANNNQNGLDNQYPPLDDDPFTKIGEVTNDDWPF